MKKTPTSRTGRSTCLVALTLLNALWTSGAHAATSAEVSAVLNNVRLFEESGTVKPATVGDTVAGSTALRTGARSRSELRFEDKSILRVGSNTHFSFTDDRGRYELKSGAVFLQTGKESKGARVRSGAITAAVTGSAAYFLSTERHGEIGSLGGTVSAIIEPPNGKKKTIELQPGQMALIEKGPNGLPTGVVKTFWFDVERMIRSATLLHSIPNSEAEETAENMRKGKANNALSLVPTGSSERRVFQDAPEQIVANREQAPAIVLDLPKPPGPKPPPVGRPRPAPAQAPVSTPLAPVPFTPAPPTSPAEPKPPTPPAAPPTPPAPPKPPTDPPTPPTPPPVDPPRKPLVDPPVDPPKEPPVDPPVDPPKEPPVDPPVDPPKEPPVDPPVDPPIEPPRDLGALCNALLAALRDDTAPPTDVTLEECLPLIPTCSFSNALVTPCVDPETGNIIFSQPTTGGPTVGSTDGVITGISVTR